MTYHTFESVEQDAKLTTYKKNPIYSEMSLRDYFAAKAMQAFLSNDNLLKGACTWHKDGSETSIAVLAYDQADAMMKVREE